MNALYWKTVGDNIATGLGATTARRLGAGGRVLGRVGVAAGIGFGLYELFKSYHANIEQEPAYREMMVLDQERRKWSDAVSCLGRAPYADKPFGSFEEGGAVNALYPKKLLGGGGVRPADATGAGELIGRAAASIRATANLLLDERFEAEKQDLIARLAALGQELDRCRDYRPVQRELSRIVARIRPIEAGFSARIYDCRRRLQQTLGTNAAWAGLSAVTLGIVKKN